MGTTLIALIAIIIFIVVYRLATSPRSLLNGLSGWAALLFCVIAIPAGIFGLITLLDGLQLPAVIIFVVLCILWLLLVPA